METSRKPIWPTCIAAGLAGGLIFCLLYGFDIVNPLNTAWVFNPKKDIYQAYLGWSAFRISEWRFPLGLYDRFSYPGVNSIIFTDSLPLFAVGFKMFRDFLPANFQYFGIWTMFCYFMNCAIAARILHRYTSSHIAAFVGAEFFVFVPALLLRTTVHAALSGQWLVLMALSSLFLYKEKYRRPLAAFLLWFFMGFLSASVHMYFVLMCGIVLIGYCACSIVDTRKAWNTVRCLAGYIGGALLMVWLLGGFSTGMTQDRATEQGLGRFSFNLNSLWNARDPEPQGIFTLFRKLPWVDEARQAEGFSYLGLGILLMLVAGLILVVWRLLCGSRVLVKPIEGIDIQYGSAYNNRRGLSRRRQEADGYDFDDDAFEDNDSSSGYLSVSKRHEAEEKRKEGRPAAGLAVGFAVMCVTAFIVAASNIVTYNDKILFTYPLPSIVSSFMSTFRSTGRVSWILVYTVMLSAIILTLRMHAPRTGTVILAVLLLIQGGEQLADGRVEPVIIPENTQELDFSQTDVGEALSENEALSHLVITVQMNPKDYYYFGRFAVENDKTLNDFWFARPAHQEAADKANELLKETPQDVAFIFFPEQAPSFAEYALYYYDAEKYVIGTPTALDSVAAMDVGLGEAVAPAGNVIAEAEIDGAAADAAVAAAAGIDAAADTAMDAAGMESDEADAADVTTDAAGADMAGAATGPGADAVAADAAA